MEMDNILNMGWEEEDTLLDIDLTAPVGEEIQNPVNLTDPNDDADGKKSTAPVEDTITDDDLTNPNDVIDTNPNDNKELQTAFAKAQMEYLKQEGLLTTDITDFDGSVEGLKSLWEKELKEYKEGFIASRNPLIAELEKNIEEYGEDFPIANLLEIKAVNQEYNSITDEVLEDNTALQRQIYANFLKEKGFKDTTIEKMVSKAEETFTLEDVVKEDALPTLKQIGKEREKQFLANEQAAKEQAIKDNADRLAQYKDVVYKTEEVIPGIKISKEEKDALFKTITTPVKVDGFKNPVNYATAVYLKDPAKFDTALNYLLQKTKNFTDFSAIMNTATTKATKALEGKLDKENRTVKVTNNKDNNPIENPLESFYRNFTK